MALRAFNPFGKSEKEKLDYYIQALREGKSEADLLKDATDPNQFARKSIQSAKTPTGLTALAKTLAAGVNRVYTDKAEASERSVLKQAIAEKAAQEKMATMEGIPEGIDPAMVQRGIVSGEVSPQDITAMQQSPEQQFQVAKEAAMAQERGQRTDDVNRAKLGQIELAESATTDAEQMVFEDGTIRDIARDNQGNPIDTATGDKIDLTGAVSYADSIKGKTKKRLSATNRRKMAEFTGLQRRSNDLIAKIKDLNERGIETKNKWRDIGREGARSLLPTAVNALETEYRDKEVLGVLDEIENLSAELLHKKYGGALTSGEQERGKRWDPAAMGISDERTIQRLETIALLAGDNATDLAGEGYGSTEEPTVTTETGETEDGSYASRADRMAHARNLKDQGYTRDQIAILLEEMYGG